MVNPIGPAGPVTPPEGPDPETLFNPTGLSEDTQEALDATLETLRDGIIIAEPRITINELFASTVNTLLELITALKEADLESNKNLLLSTIEQADSLNQSLANDVSNALAEEPQMATLQAEAGQVDTAANNVESARDNYNAAVDAYIVAQNNHAAALAAYNLDPTPPNDVILANAVAALNTATTNLNNAITALNGSIDAYNSEVDDYNNQIQLINDTRLLTGNPLLGETNGLFPLASIPEGEKITFPSTDLVPSVVTVPPTITFNDSDDIYTNLGTVGIDNEYRQAFSTYELALANLNLHIAAMNAAAQEPGFDVAVDYPPLAETYNELVAAVNAAQSNLETERDNWNALNLPGDPLTWDDTPVATIPTSVAVYSDLSAITTNSVNVVWSDPFEVAAQEYNDAVTAYNAAQATLNATIASINTAFQQPSYDFASDYATLANQYNTALVAYNAAVADLQAATANWNGLTNHGTLGTIGSPLTFEILPEDPLPLGVTAEPPPKSNLSFPTILNTDLYEVFFTTSPDITTAVDNLADDQAIVSNLLEVIADRELLSLIFLARGKATSEIFEPTADGVAQGTPEGAAVGGTLGSILFGLSSPRVQSAISKLDVAEVVNTLFTDLAIETPRGLAQAFQNLTVRGGVNAALASIRFVLVLAFELLKTQNPDSFPINLATFVALAQALVAVGGNGGFTDLARQSLAGLEGVNDLQSDNKEALFTTVGNLSTFGLTFSAFSDLGSVGGTTPEFALGSLALNISFGSAGSQLDLREALKSIPDTLQGTDLDNFQKDLTDAFTDVLVSGGIAGDASKTLAIRFAEGLFAAEDPGAFIRESLSGFDGAEVLGGQIANLAILASFSPQLEGLAGKFTFGEGDPQFEVIKQRLANAGFGNDVAGAFLGNGEGSFLQQVARLQGSVEPEAIRVALGAIRDLEIAVALKSKLGGDVGDSEAQALIKSALESINSLDNQTSRIIKDLIDQDNLEAINNIADFVKELFKSEEKPEVFLSELTNPAKTALRFGSLYWEGTIPRGIKMRTDSGPTEISIPA